MSLTGEKDDRQLQQTRTIQSSSTRSDDNRGDCSCTGELGGEWPPSSRCICRGSADNERCYLCQHFQRGDSGVPSSDGTSRLDCPDKQVPRRPKKRSSRKDKLQKFNCDNRGESSAPQEPAHDGCSGEEQHGPALPCPGACGHPEEYCNGQDDGEGSALERAGEEGEGDSGPLHTAEGDRAGHSSTGSGQLRPKSHTKEYKLWCNIKWRCHCKTSRDYHKYGARGIFMWEGWLQSFENFLNDIGNSPSMSHSLDRIDNNLGYCPGNVQWATPVAQTRNRRNTIRVTWDGEEIALAELCEKLGLDKRKTYRLFKKYKCIRKVIYGE